MNWWGLLFLGTGIFAVAGAILDWDWFMESRKARFFVAVLGRNGARAFYFILGAAIAVMGILMTAGIITGSE